METCNKPVVMALSIAQIVLSAAFFLLGMVDGFHIQFVHVSPTFLPCWIAPLVLPVGVMGLALSSNQTLRLLQLLKYAIWSLCVVCIICSALILYIYTSRGLLYIAYFAHSRNTGRATWEEDGLFVPMGAKIMYSEKEKAARVVFTFVVICSVIEISLAAAMMKICDTTTKIPQVSPSCVAYFQTGVCQQSPQGDPVGQQQVRGDVRDNQSSQCDVMNHQFSQ